MELTISEAPTAPRLLKGDFMILIAYASKTGNAQQAAQKLAELLPGASLCDLTKMTPQLENYDSVIIGAGVRMNSIHKDAKEFLEKNQATLGTKKLAIFISNCFADTTDQVLQTAVSDELRGAAVWMGSVGGRLDMAKLKGLDKIVAMAASKAVKDDQRVNVELDEVALDKLAACFYQ